MILLREKFQLIACQTTKFVRERGLLVSNRVRKGTIAPQRDGGGEGCATGGEASADVVSRRGGASARFFRENRSSGATGRNIVKAVCP